MLPEFEKGRVPQPDGIIGSGKVEYPERNTRSEIEIDKYLESAGVGGTSVTTRPSLLPLNAILFLSEVALALYTKRLLVATESKENQDGTLPCLEECRGS